MAAGLFEIQSTDVPFRSEVSFTYKGEVHKVHIHKSLEGNETIYKLYFKNNFEDTNKSMMKLIKTTNANGTNEWACKKDYFCIMNEEMAVAAGAAIDKVLQDKAG